MLFNDLFQRQKIRDRSFRMSFPKESARGCLLFSKYASGVDYQKICRHVYPLQTLVPIISEQLLDFEPEGRWLCLQNWVRTGSNPRVGFPGVVTSKLAFERQADYAMFRLFGFGE